LPEVGRAATGERADGNITAAMLAVLRIAGIEASL
jgi:hypothetical protein